MDNILDVLISIVKKAGTAIADIQGQDINERYKAKGDLLTRADKFSHSLIDAELKRYFPNIPLVLEEQGNSTVPQSQFIVGDELDGTIPFARGMNEWSVSLAYIDEQPTHGVIFLPSLKILISAEKGKGCWINNKCVHLTSTNRLAESVWGTELNPLLTDEHRQRFINTLSQYTLSTRCLACATAGILELLLGHTNLYINCKGGNIWDFAAGALSVEEAGGIASDIDGTKIEWNSIEMNVLLAANMKIADEALKLTIK